MLSKDTEIEKTEQSQKLAEQTWAVKWLGKTEQNT